MRVLITGNKGFIGSKLEKKLRTTESDIHTVDLKEGRDVINLRIGKYELIYHLAGQTSVTDSWKYPLIDARNNILTALKLASEFQDSKIVFTQSAASLDRLSPYGLSKKVAEDYFKLFDSDVVNLLLPNIYGGGKGIVDIMKESEVITLYGDGKQSRTFVHVDDVIEALVLAKDWKKGKYHLGTGLSHSVIELAKLTGKQIEFKPDEDSGIFHSLIYNTTPNWEAKVNVEEYMEK